MSQRKINSSPKPQYLRMWPCLKIGSLQMFPFWPSPRVQGSYKERQESWSDLGTTMSLKDTTHLEMFWERQRKSRRGLHSLSFWLPEQKGSHILFLGSQLVVISVVATKKKKKLHMGKVRIRSPNLLRSREGYKVSVIHYLPQA